MFSKRILIRDAKTGKEFHVKKASYNLAALDEQQWYFDDGSKTLFSKNSSLLQQLEDANAGSELYGQNHEKLFTIVSVGTFTKP